MTTTIKELAKAAGVSIATVSRALNNDGKVKEDTRKRITDLAKKLDYNPNLLARTFVTKKSNIIGLVMPDIHGEFFMEVIRGVDQQCFANGYYTMVTSSHSSRSIVEAIMDFMSKGIVGGIILMTPSIDAEIRKTLKNSRLPIVVISGKRDYEKSDSISIDNYNGAYSVVDYLINSQGYKKIAHISGPLDNNDAIERQKGYLDALADNKIKFNKNWLFEGDFSINGGQAATEKLMTLKDRPDCIFAANDMMALGCYVAARFLKMKIPSDFGVAGFDDIFVSQFLNPRLTTVHVPIFELGREAANMLITRLNDPHPKNYLHMMVSTELIVGESC